MFPIPSTPTLRLGMHDIGSEPLAFHLPTGSAIVAYSGTIWLTQEGLLDDVILRAGGRFTVRNSRRIVVSAWRGRARMRVAAPATADIGDQIDRARNKAKRLRAEAFDHAFAAADHWLSRAIANAGTALQRAFAPARRAASH